MIATSHLKDWNRFAQAVDDLCDNRVNDRAFIFRGVGQERWHLETSFDRQVKASLKERNAKFNVLMSRFIESAKRTGLSCASEDEWIGLAQHYGLKTRVLDWSFSPYVAAFFAVAAFLDSDRKDVPVIYALDRIMLESKLDDQEFRFIEQTSTANLRLRQQKGLFSQIKNDVGTLEEFLKAKGLTKALRKMRIAKDVVPMAIRSVSLMDISYERLLPGVEGICKQVWFDFQAE